MFDPATDGLSTGGMTQVANAHILGHEIIGTAGDPNNRTTLENNPTNPNQIGWQEAARRANIIGAAMREEGMRGYYSIRSRTRSDSSIRSRTRSSRRRT